MTKSVYLICGLLAALLVSPNGGAAQNAEATDTASVQTSSASGEADGKRCPDPHLRDRIDWGQSVNSGRCLATFSYLL